MTTQQNKSILTQVFAETAKGNGRPFVDALAENVSWTIIGSTPWSKTYAGKGSVINELLRPLGRQLGGSSVIKASNFIAAVTTSSSKQLVTTGRCLATNTRTRTAGSSACIRARWWN